jgi:hypothetical protein
MPNNAYSGYRRNYRSGASGQGTTPSSSTSSEVRPGKDIWGLDAPKIDPRTVAAREGYAEIRKGTGKHSILIERREEAVREKARFVTFSYRLHNDRTGFRADAEGNAYVNQFGCAMADIRYSLYSRAEAGKNPRVIRSGKVSIPLNVDPKYFINADGHLNLGSERKIRRTVMAFAESSEPLKMFQDRMGFSHAAFPAPGTGKHRQKKHRRSSGSIPNSPENPFRHSLY